MASVQSALDIGRQAELYSFEHNLSTALDSYTLSLNTLVPLLRDEPPGPRKELLQHQVMEWMKDAESIKSLLSAKEMKENKNNHQHCIIQ